MTTASSFTTDSVIQAASWLRSGQLLAYPTESVWGMGCDPFNENAVRELLSIKQRPIDKGMIVVTDSSQRIEPLLTSLSPTQRRAVIASWQIDPNKSNRQAQTWLLPIDNSLKVAIPTWITGNHQSVAVRVIAHPLIQQLCEQLVANDNPYGFIVSTSCNLSGQPPALSLQQAQDYFLNNTDSRTQSHLTQQVGFLSGETLGYKLPSQINNALTGKLIR